MKVVYVYVTLDKMVEVSAGLETAVSNIGRKVIGAETLSKEKVTETKQYYQHKGHEDDTEKKKWSESMDNSFGKIGLASLEGSRHLHHI